MRNALRVATWCFIAMMMVGLAAAVKMRPLGILPKLEDFLFLMAAVFALTALAFVVNRAMRISYPVWQGTPLPVSVGKRTPL